MQTVPFIERHHSWAEELGELSRGPPSHQVHVKVTFLGVYEPERASDVLAFPTV